MPQRPVQGSYGLPTTIGGARPCPVAIPNSYSQRKKYALVVVLHSYGGPPLSTVAKYFTNIDSARNSMSGAIVLYPSGTLDLSLNAFWNANDPCCNFNGSTVNDVNYIAGLILEAMSIFSIDPSQVEVVGYSNGGMMAHTMGLCRPDLVTAVYSFAGYAPFPSDTHYCVPGYRVHVTHIHGDIDPAVLYPGDATGAVLTDVPSGIYQGALSTCTNWGALNGCSGSFSQYDSRDLTGGLAGTETDRFRFDTQAVNGSVELWRINGGDHVIGMNTAFIREIELRRMACRRI